MDPEEGLEAAKEPVYEFPSDLKTLGRSDPLVFVKADDVVGIHPARVFSPLLLLVQEAPIHAFSIYLIRTVRTCDIDKSFRDLITPEDICDDVAHCTVALCCAIDDLIDCHISSLSFLFQLPYTGCKISAVGDTRHLVDVGRHSPQLLLQGCKRGTYLFQHSCLLGWDDGYACDRIDNKSLL